LLTIHAVEFQYGKKMKSHKQPPENKTSRTPTTEQGLKKSTTKVQGIDEYSATGDGENLLHAFFDSPGAMRGIVEIVDDTTIRHIVDNLVTAGYLGLTTGDLRNKLSSELGEPPEIIRLWVNHYKQSMQTGKPVTFEYEDQRGDHKTWLSATVSFLGLSQSGQPQFTYVVVDITERREIEQQLFEQAAMLANANDAIIAYDKNFRVRYWNQAAEKIYGYSAKEAVGKVSNELLKPAYTKVSREQLIENLARDGHIEVESERFTKSGKKITVETHVIKLLDSSSNLTGYVAVDRDITERKQTEKNLREARDYLDNLFNYANAPIIVWNSSFEITRFNHAFERLTGRTSEEMLGKKVDILIPKEQRKDALIKINQTMVKGERWEVVEIPIQNVDGSVRTFLWNSATLYDTDGKTVIATIAQGQDITERKRAEESLRETRDYLDNLLNYANAPIIVWNPEFVITRFNHAFERITGRTADEVIGKKLDILFPDDSRKASLELIRQTLIGERWEAVEIPIKNIDGTARTVLWNSATLYNPDGKVSAAIAQGQDITERKKSDQIKDEFIGMVSHELRTPLTVIIGALGTAKDERISREERDELVQDARSSAESLASILDNMLELSRYQAGRLNLDRKTVKIADIANRAVQRVRRKYDTHELILDIPDGLPDMNIDVVRIEQVLYNLIENAVKYSPPGSRIRIFSLKDERGLVIGVSDSGIGISPEDQQKIFEPFARLQTNGTKGVGLGLVVCKRLVEAHGGHIWVESQSNQGSTFLFALP
jgi:PAS domain S-box-containing protein